MPGRTTRIAALTLVLAGVCACQMPQAENDAAAVEETVTQARANADARSLELAQALMDALGGQDAWDATRFVQWRFFGSRMHHWDRHSGDIRIHRASGTDREGNEYPEMLLLMNVLDGSGRAWIGGEEVPAAELSEALERGMSWWINDSYWMFMPYKLLDPGVNLTYAGERELADGRMADVLDLTFDAGIGETPENRYEVFIARDTGLVEQWSFFAEAGEAEPRFTLPWADWQEFGDIRLATRHRDGDGDWEIAVLSELPRAVFESPEPIP